MGDVARSRVPRFTLLFTAPAARTLDAERMICADDGRLCALMPLCADDGRLCALSKPRASIDWRQATLVEVWRQALAGCADAKAMLQRHKKKLRIRPKMKLENGFFLDIFEFWGL